MVDGEGDVMVSPYYERRQKERAERLEEETDNKQNTSQVKA